MNERLKELAKQAGIDIFPISITGSTESLEKFAELIVRECAEVAYDADADHGDAILEHFDLPYISD